MNTNNTHLTYKFIITTVETNVELFYALNVREEFLDT